MVPYSLPIGVHLATPRFGYVHHGVYAGNGRVIHSAGFKTLFGRGPVEEVSLEEFGQGRGWRIRNWPRTKAEGLARVARARSRLGEDTYRFWSNNCEHFVEWCTSGAPRSAQVERFKTQVFGVIAMVFGLMLAACAQGEASRHRFSLVADERLAEVFFPLAALDREIQVGEAMRASHEATRLLRGGEQ